jgi:hypothetical protein
MLEQPYRHKFLTLIAKVLDYPAGATNFRATYDDDDYLL